MKPNQNLFIFVGFTDILSNIQEINYSNLTQTILRVEKERHSLLHLLRPTQCGYEILPNREGKIYSSVSLMNIKEEVLFSQPNADIVREHFHDQIVFSPEIQDWLNIGKPINVIHYINR